jgi:D-xylose transport system ATP-binding protein
VNAPNDVTLDGPDDRDTGSGPGEGSEVAREPVLSLRGISKRFGAVEALSDASLDVYAGEVVALVGDNGAGKSTMIKVIAGVNPADGGDIRWEGKPVSIAKPSDATGLGIATVYQDLALCDNLDVVANLYLGHELASRNVLDEIGMERAATNLLQTLSVRIPSVRIPVASLSGGQRQSVAIARSLLGEPRVVLLDEPTAALGVAQTAQVLDLIERLRDRGHGVVLISHNLADVKAVADRVTVLRLGRVVGDFAMQDTSQEQIVQAITGASDNVVARRASRASADGGANVRREPHKDWTVSDTQERS